MSKTVFNNIYFETVFDHDQELLYHYVAV